LLYKHSDFLKDRLPYSNTKLFIDPEDKPNHFQPHKQFDIEKYTFTLRDRRLSDEDMKSVFKNLIALLSEQEFKQDMIKENLIDFLPQYMLAELREFKY